MKTLIWLVTLFTISMFIFTATVNAANKLAQNLGLDKPQHTISELMIK